MGDSLPPPAAIDLVGSFARRRGAEVEVVFWDPKLDVTPTSLLLTKGPTAIDGRVELIKDVAGRRLVAHVAGVGLTEGIWSMQLSSSTRADERVDARLLVQGERPIVLLWGAETKPSRVPSTRTSSRKRRAAAAAGATLDRALAGLPPERAVQVRSSIRRTARRVLR